MLGQTERRVASVDIDERDVLAFFIFGIGKNLPRQLCVPQIVGVPEDVSLEGVHHDPLTKSFRFVLSHPSFDRIWPGQEPPRLKHVANDVQWKWHPLDPTIATPDLPHVV